METIEISWLKKTNHRPHFTGTCVNTRGVWFHRIRNFKQYYFNSVPPTSVSCNENNVPLLGAHLLRSRRAAACRLLRQVKPSLKTDILRTNTYDAQERDVFNLRSANLAPSQAKSKNGLDKPGLCPIRMLRVRCGSESSRFSFYKG